MTRAIKYSSESNLSSAAESKISHPSESGSDKSIQSSNSRSNSMASSFAYMNEAGVRLTH